MRSIRLLIWAGMALSGIFGMGIARAQQCADKIVAIVGRNRVILQSEIDMEAQQWRDQNPAMADSMNAIKVTLLQQRILQAMLVEQAERDSVLVTDEDVDGQLDNRIRYFTQLAGSKEKLEESAGKTIYQLKEENRAAIKDQMVSEKMQGQILEAVRITPAEVEAFYAKLPKDSLPYFPAAVEVGQVVIDPPVSTEMDDYAHNKIEQIRKDIVENGKSFEIEAGIYSDDPGSRDNGGRYDGVSRTGGFAPEFVAAAFKLQNGEISPIVKTKFGYHIIQMIQRRGEEVDVRHILIRPQLTSGDFQKAVDRLNQIRDSLVAGKITFPEAVGKYSTDEAAKRTGGMIADPATGNTTLEITKLDPSMVLLIDSLQPGDYSHPHVFYTETRDQSCRIVLLKSRTAPHKANLREDYSRIQEVALTQKKSQRIIGWVTEKLPTYYLWIDPEYRHGVLKEWSDNASNTNQNAESKG
jgi:peptidyl-prolyl cis-trans isomerase SurA